MKLLILVLILLVLPQTVNAESIVSENSSVSVSVQNRVNTGGEVRQEIRQQVQAKGEEVKVKLSATTRERVRFYFYKAVTRTEALIERLNLLISKIETRIEKIKESSEDFDTAKVEEDVKDAKGLISSSTKDLENSKTLLENSLSSESPKDSFKEVVEVFKNIKTDLMEVHKLLVHAIGELKGLRIGN